MSSNSTTVDAAAAFAPIPPGSGGRIVNKPGHLGAVLPAPTVITAEIIDPDTAKRDALSRHSDTTRETFIPITKSAIIDRLAMPEAWHEGQAGAARKFFQYLDYWRRQTYTAALRSVDKSYEAFNPDSDLLATRAYSPNERGRMQADVVHHVRRLLKQANYVRIDLEELEALTTGSHYGLELKVDLKAFDELEVYYRGRSSRKEERREPRKFYRKIEFDVPIYRRLFVLFKLKPFDARVAEIMIEEQLSRKDAEKHVTKLRSLLSAQIKTDNIYMKLFKNMPRSDVEMIFPNTRVSFRRFDKIKLGVTSGAGLGMGLFGAAGKIALAASNPLAAAGAVFGLGGIAVRQGVNFMNQRQRYMVVMAQNLYFHAMADNRSAMIKLADRAAEEDVKEEMLIYSVLCKRPAHRSELSAVDQAIESYLKKTFDIDVNFDLQDALERLIADGLVTESADGFLIAMQPLQAADHIDKKWDVFLNDLMADDMSMGVEVDT